MLLSFGVLLFCVSNVMARTIPDPSNPAGFFTTVADKLLRSTFSFGITNIPVQTHGVFVYTPAVNRLLQVAANVLDAANTNFYPTVFRPVFYRDAAGNVFITGYQQVVGVNGVNDALLASPVDISELPPGISTNNVYEVPWILGAKKNLPAFNKFYLFNVTAVTRKLQVWRANAYVPGALETNQMFVLGITNRVGVSFWNPYNAPLTNQSGQGYTVVLRDHVNMALTNAANPTGAPTPFGSQYFWPNLLPGDITFVTNLTVWPGCNWGVTPQDFAGNLPEADSYVFTNADYVFLPESAFYPSLNLFYRLSLNPFPAFDLGGAPSVPAFPQFGLLTTNAMQAYILDGTNIVDYVHFAGPNSSENISESLRDKTFIPADNQRIINGTAMWVTNYVGNATAGVRNQVTVSFPLLNGTVRSGLPGGGWRKPGNMGTLPITPQNEAAFFSGFYFPMFQSYPHTLPPVYYQNLELTNQVPYTPTRYVYDYTFLQANDPLVHYLYADLVDPDLVNRSGRVDDPLLLPHPDYVMDKLSDPQANVAARYQPWGRNDQLASKTGSINNSEYNLPLRDPLVWGADFWNFPTNKLPSAGWLGRVHRGTPWQTVFLKSGNVLIETNSFGNVGTNTWLVWTGDMDLADAALTAPVNDWKIVSLLAAMFNTNDATQLSTVNNTLTGWQAALADVTVQTNTSETVGFYDPPQFSPVVMSSNSPQARLIAAALVHAVTNQMLHSVSDIFKVQEISELSPWLNLSDWTQLDFGVSDDAYEAIPSQLLPRLRSDSTGSMIFTNDSWLVQFSGEDAFDYRLQFSPNLSDWMNISTNQPGGGLLLFSMPTNLFPASGFFRSVLLP